MRIGRRLARLAHQRLKFRDPSGQPLDHLLLLKQQAILFGFAQTKARFWLAFGVVWLSQLLITVLSFGLAAGLGWVIQSSDSATAQVIAQSVSSAIATTITLPFAAAALVVLYFDLRIRTEAFDVQMMIARLDASRAADAMPA